MNPIPIKRDVGGKFAKGQTANPLGSGGGKEKTFLVNGKPLDQAALYALRAGEACEELLKIAKDNKLPATARVAACREINDRAFGKAVHSIYHSTSKKPESRINVDELSEQTLREIIAASTEVANEDE